MPASAISLKLFIAILDLNVKYNRKLELDEEDFENLDEDDEDQDIDDTPTNRHVTTSHVNIF